MNSILYSISPSLFERSPGYLRGIVLAANVNNSFKSDEITELLREAEASVRGRIAPSNAPDHPNLQAWREGFRAFGIKPSEFRPSNDALARRPLNGNQLPSFSPLVDIANIVALKYLTPIGSHALDEVNGDICLRLASGDESFTPLNGAADERPNSGEPIFAEARKVMTRRWTWRQGKHTLTVPESKRVVINVDALPPLRFADVAQICHEVSEMVRRFCGGATTIDILRNDHPQVVIRNGTLG